VAFVLSLSNVLFDFSSVLMQIEAEERMAKQIKTRIDDQLEKEKLKLLQKKDDQSAVINKKYEDAGIGSLEQKRQELNAVAAQYQESLQMCCDEGIAQLEIEIKQYREKLRKERQLLRGKDIERADAKDGEDPENDAAHRGNMLAEAKKNFAAREETLNKISEDARKELTQLEPNAEDFQERYAKITENWHKRANTVKMSFEPLLGGA
jgi:hypothetical protein